MEAAVGGSVLKIVFFSPHFFGFFLTRALTYLSLQLKRIRTLVSKITKTKSKLNFVRSVQRLREPETEPDPDPVLIKNFESGSVYIKTLLAVANP
jgi:hypothetical protein